MLAEQHIGFSPGAELVWNLQMVDPATVTAMAHQVHAQHVELHRMTDTIKQQADRLGQSEDVKAAAASLREVMPKLRVFLRRHFQQEEQGGWLEDAACSLPRLSHCLTDLERQHQALLRETDEALALLSRPLPALAEAAGAFQSLAEALLAHEAQEEEVLAEGFNQESGFAE